MMNGYNFDALNNTLTISASFAKKASKVGSPEYNTILKLRHDFPNLTIQQEEKKEGKKNLTYAKMEDFMNMHRNSKELRETFERVKKLSRIQPMPYKYVKTWFDNRFPYYSDEPNFDNDGYVVAPNTAVEALKMVKDIAQANNSDYVPAEGAVA